MLIGRGRFKSTLQCLLNELFILIFVINVKTPQSIISGGKCKRGQKVPSGTARGGAKHDTLQGTSLRNIQEGLPFCSHCRRRAAAVRLPAVPPSIYAAVQTSRFVKKKQSLVKILFFSSFVG